VYLYEAATGQETLRFQGAGNATISFAPDEKSLAVCNPPNTVRIHSASDGKTLWELKHDGYRLVNASFSPDGRSLASLHVISTDEVGERRIWGEAGIWDLATGKERYRLKSSAGYYYTSVAFSPDSRYVALGGDHPDLVLWDVATGKELRRFTSGGFVKDVVFSPDGKTLAAASWSCIQLWDVATGKLRPMSADPFIDSGAELSFSADGKQLLAGASRPIVWNATTGREIRRYAKIPDILWWRATMSPDKSLIATTDWDGAIRLWDASTAKEVRTLKGHEKWVSAMSFSADSRRLFSSGRDNTIRVWDVRNGRELQRHSEPGVSGACMAGSADGRWLAFTNWIAGRYETVLWDLSAGKENARFTMGRNWPRHLAFSPDSRLLAAAADSGGRDESSQVRVWDMNRRKEWRSLDSGETGVGHVAFSPDARMLATGSWDGTLSLWELCSGRKRHQFKGHECSIGALAFSPDGRLLAASSGEAPVYIWDVAGLLQLPAPKPSAADLERCWTDLAGDDAATAFRAVRLLVSTPGPAVAFLRGRAAPVPPPDAERVQRLLKDLDSPTFTVREKASAELDGLADRAASTLRQALAGTSAPEVRRRLQQILDRLERGTPETLRATRAVEALELIATPEAFRLLARLATGAPDACLTQEAQATLLRLSKRPAAAP
jgi:WD40 repeat protein